MPCSELKRTMTTYTFVVDADKHKVHLACFMKTKLLWKRVVSIGTANDFYRRLLTQEFEPSREMNVTTTFVGCC